MKYTLLTFLFLVACAKSTESETVATDVSQTLNLQFAAKVGSETFDCTRSYSGIGSTNTTIQPKDFRFYIHDVKLVKSDGTEISVTLTPDGAYQYENLALLDFENNTGTCTTTTGPTAATNTKIVGTFTAPSNVSVTKVRFKYGIPTSLNHLDVATAPAPLNISALFWSWTSGRKHARLDFKTVGGAYDAGYNLHLGNTNCTGTAPNITCVQVNVAAIELSFSLGKTVVVDLKNLLSSQDLNTVDQGGPAGCMSGTTDPECKDVFNAGGISFSPTVTNATRGVISGTVYSSSAQTLFRVE